MRQLILLPIYQPKIRVSVLPAKKDRLTGRIESFIMNRAMSDVALRLWEAYQEAWAVRAHSATVCPHPFLSPRRMREWADTRHQLWFTYSRLGKKFTPFWSKNRYLMDLERHIVA